MSRDGGGIMYSVRVWTMGGICAQEIACCSRFARICHSFLSLSGPGYRLYFLDQDGRVIVLLCGGDKRTQDANIKRAIEIANDWRKL